MIYVNTEEVKVDGKIAEKAQEKKMIWDEENRLQAIDINGYVSNYTYDAGGERVTTDRYRDGTRLVLKTKIFCF